MREKARDGGSYEAELHSRGRLVPLVIGVMLAALVAAVVALVRWL